MKFTRIPESAFKELVLNAGYLATTFDPAAGTASVRSAVNLAVLEGLRTAGIEIAQPQRVVLVVASTPGQDGVAPAALPPA